MGSVHVDVCVITYQRPALLLQALRSIAKQETTGIAMRLIVVDNDCRRSAYKAVESFTTEAGIDVTYVVEPTQGIAAARNRGLDNVTADYVAFLDDDEEAAPNWLRSLLATSQSLNADVVFGPVFRVLPSIASNWARMHPAFARTAKPTGSLVLYGGAGNVLIRSSVFANTAARFNANFGLTGGEDLEFFNRIRQRGKRMVWCQEAEVTEKVPVERTRLAWLCKRAFRGGQTFGRVFLPEYGPGKKACWLVLKGSQVLCGTAALPILFVISFSRFVIVLTRVCSACGQVSAILGSRLLYREYGVSNRSAVKD